MFIAGSNAATTTASLTTGAIAATTITASGAVAFQSTFAVTGTTTLAALTTSGTVTFNAFTVTNVLTVSGATTLTGAVTATNASNNITGVTASVTGTVTVGTNNDKTGYSLTQTFPSNFSSLAITAGGIVQADLQTIKTQTVTCAGGVTVPAATLASTTNITAGTITTVTNLTNAATNGDLTTTMKASVNTEADLALADVGLTTTVTGRIDVAISTRLATAGYTAPLDAAGTRTAIGLATANLDTQLSTIDTVVDAILADTGTDGVVLSAATANQVADALLDRANGVETSITPRQSLRAIAALLVGTIAGAGTGTEVFKNIGGSTTRVTVTVDASGNRTVMTLNL